MDVSEVGEPQVASQARVSQIVLAEKYVIGTGASTL
jgi:hypothetical protein